VVMASLERVSFGLRTAGDPPPTPALPRKGGGSSESSPARGTGVFVPSPLAGEG
jgi:hypothetical protein